MDYKIIIFIISIFIVKNITVNTDLLVNIAILSSVCYYYYYTIQKDSIITKSLGSIVNETIDVPDKITLHLNTLSNYSKEHSNIDKDTLYNIIYFTNKSYKNNSSFYKKHVIKTMDNLHYVINDPTFDTIKNNIVNELNSTIKEGPQSYSKHDSNPSFSIF